jgi:hypothetical protein
MICEGKTESKKGKRKILRKGKQLMNEKRIKKGMVK